MMVSEGLRFKNEEISVKIGEYLIKGAQYFVPFEITLNNYRHLEPLLKIGRKIKFIPSKIQRENSKILALYLQGQSIE